MTAAIAVTSNTSSRLLEMLENNPQWPTEKKGLCTEICNTLQDFAYATVHKWLYQNSLPRTPEERQLVASKLGVDLIYWEYGVYSTTNAKPALHIEPIHYLKHSNAVQQAINNKGLKIGKDLSEQALLKIQQLSIHHCTKHGILEPDKQLIEDALEIALIAKP
ncbi:MAG: hypothetical protein CL602_01680 [Alteromonas sp.]|uniref:Uncharacterized protein n=1 Tax=Alteromonas australica TaxID=589873 RepID=A0A358DZZ8_9ALTE|nr:hypothetical protein [Alteromonas australica]MBU32606.1 hypothetical protein [Alteromonas sp.]HBU51502.1 hypothetical protein [Alteromonas australica]|tara:strand:- start:33605 stop:34093 length:489 start_codon:yes stop_codon:yes gene_type:complete